MGILQGESPSTAMYWQPYTSSSQQQQQDEEVKTSENNNNSETMQSFHREDAVKEELVEEDRKPSVTVCAGCRFAISDRFYLVAVDKPWHSQCLRCDECRRPLETALSCFARQNRIYCRDDYHRLFGGRKHCAKCGDELQSDELVMRGRDHLFHTRCFTCHVCQTHLIKGSTFGMVGPLIFCQHHYQQPATPPTPPPVQPELSPPFQPGEQPYHHLHHHYEQFHHFQPGYGHHELMPQPQQTVDGKLFASSSPLKNNGSSQQANRVRTKRRPNMKSETMIEREEDGYGDLMDTSSSMLGVVSDGGGNNQQQKTKRLRTSFKHQQLRMLKSYFATNHNPDAKDLKQLSQKTSLSKRVLQVWFQNARAKWRRLVQKTEGNAAAGGAVSSNNSSLANASCHSSGSGSEGNDSPAPHHQGGVLHHGYGMTDHLGLHHHQHQALMSRSRMSLYDDLSLSSSASVASVGFPSPL